MIDKKIAHNIVRDILKRKKGLTNHQIMHPQREWFLGLTVALFFLCLSTAWSVSLYQKYSHMNQKPNDGNEASAVVYRENIVAEALEEFATRKQTYSDIKTRLLNQEIVSSIPASIPVLVTDSVATTSTSTIEVVTPEPTPLQPELIEDPAPLPIEDEGQEVLPNLNI